MRISRKFVLIVGVTLGVAPIFSSAWAQQSNQQATMLLEIQALRAEIAELRDMVERQQHQMQIMQRSTRTPKAPQAEVAAGPNNSGVAQSAPAVASSIPTPNQNSAGLNAPPQAAQGAQAGNIPMQQTVPIGTAPSGLPNSAGGSPSATNVAEEPAPAFAQDQAGFYRPYPDNPVAQTEITGSATIEERILTPNTPPIVPASSQETPVEERLVGQRAAPIDAAAVPPSNTGSPVSGTPAAGVIALPNPTQAGLPTGIPQNQGVLNQNVATQNVPLQAPAPVPAVNSQTANNQFAIQPSQSFPANQTAPQMGTQTAPIAAPVVLPETDYYQQGFDLLKQSRHAQAVETFKQQIRSYPQGDLVDDAHYWIAESMYVNRSLDISKQYFKAIIDNFTQSPRLPDAMLKTAYIEQEQGNQIEARILLQEIIQYHPRSNAAISAKNRLAELE